MVRQEMITKMRQVADKILPAGGTVLLYGSRARGDARDTSDWDLLILLDKATIEENANCLKSRSDVKSVQVVGHCDERGTEEYNMALGKRRADAVKNVLSRMGVKSISTKSRGNLDPVVSGASSESDHQRNRRAEFLINP